jgi:hypothetical protein
LAHFFLSSGMGDAMLKRIVRPRAKERDVLLMLAAAYLLCHALGAWPFGRLGRLVLALVTGKAIGMACRKQPLLQPSTKRK